MCACAPQYGKRKDAHLHYRNDLIRRGLPLLRNAEDKLEYWHSRFVIQITSN